MGHGAAGDGAAVHMQGVAEVFGFLPPLSHGFYAPIGSVDPLVRRTGAVSISSVGFASKFPETGRIQVAEGQGGFIWDTGHTLALQASVLHGTALEF